MSSHSSPPIHFDVAIHQIIREEWGHVLSILINQFKDIDLSEDALQDAVEVALQKWKIDGIPKKTGAWLLKVARNKAIDLLRRNQNFQKKLDAYSVFQDEINDNKDKEDSYDIPEERLRLIFTCCHPSLDQEISVALTLQLLGGLTTAEIARAFLIKKETMAQRLVRGKRKIKQAAIPYIIPEKDIFQERLDAVLAVIYLIFNEGYSASSGKNHVRADLTNEAIRLASLLYKLCPEEPEVMALLALMLLHDSRRKSRFTLGGEFVPLEEQDRMLWDQSKIKEGRILIEMALKKGRVGPYQIQAAISAVHAQSRSFAETDWREIVLLYDELLNFLPTPVIKLNRIVAASNFMPLRESILELNKLEEEFKSYQPYFATKADFYSRAGNLEIAKKSYHKAIELSGNENEREFLLKKLKAI